MKDFTLKPGLVKPATIDKSAKPLDIARSSDTQLMYHFVANQVALAGVRTIAAVFTSFQFGRELFLRQVIVSAQKNSGVDLWTTTDARLLLTSLNGARPYAAPITYTLGANGAFDNTTLELYCPASNMPLAIDLGPSAFRIIPTDTFSLQMVFSANFAGGEPLIGDIYFVCDQA